jgi:hypothetical protein
MRRCGIASDGDGGKVGGGERWSMAARWSTIYSSYSTNLVVLCINGDTRRYSG